MINKNKGVSLFCVLICLVSLSAFTSIVKAQSAGAIYINADGSVSGTSMIQQDGNIYRLKGSIFDSPITVLCNNIILDGEGFALQGPGGYPTPAAINLTCTNVVVQNFIVEGWEVGILGANSNNVIASNNVTDNERDIAVYANGYKITGNYMSDADYAVRIIGNNNIILQNVIMNHAVAFWITDSSNNIITDNNITSTNPSVFDTDFVGLQVYHNNFININPNMDIVVPDTNASKAILPHWDNGYPSGGNYWSDYTNKYPNATEIDNSGIGNTAYLISTNPNVLDRYPLLSPINISQGIVELPLANPSPMPNLTSTPSSQPTKSMPSEVIYAIVTGIIVVIAITTVVMLRKRKPQSPTMLNPVT